MFRERSEGFLALPMKDAAACGLAQVIGDVLRAQDIEPVLPAGSDGTGSVAEDARSAIRRAEIVVADLTGADPTVLFEVGLALGMGKPLLLLSQGSVSELPVDLKAHQIALYRADDTDTVRRYAEFWLRDVLARRRSSAA